MRKLCETVIIFIGTLGWWGFVYPELSAVTETCVQETEENGYIDGICTQEMEEDGYIDEGCMQGADETAARSFFRELGEALGNAGVKSGNVRIKSHIAEYLYQEKEKDRSEKG